MIRRSGFLTATAFLTLAALCLTFSGCGKPVEEPSAGEGSADTPAEGTAAEGTAAPGTTASGQLTPEQQQEVLDALMRAKAKQQAEGLGGGRVRVNGAWNYNGYSYLSPDPSAAIEARLVAVDISVAGHTEHFDIDDIEIVDGASLLSYGSDPHATPLTPEGVFLAEGQGIAEPPGENRWLLIYAYPRNSPAFRLYYWGRELTKDPVEFDEAGLELPFPAAGEE